MLSFLENFCNLIRTQTKLKILDIVWRRKQLLNVPQWWIKAAGDHSQSFTEQTIKHTPTDGISLASTFHQKQKIKIKKTFQSWISTQVFLRFFWIFYCLISAKTNSFGFKSLFLLCHHHPRSPYISLLRRINCWTQRLKSTDASAETNYIPISANYTDIYT